MEKNIIYRNDSKARSFLMIRRPRLHGTPPASPDSDLYIGLFLTPYLLKELDIS